jgi:glutamine synthetase adenylyltransferase
MNQNPLQSLSEYSRFLSQILNRPEVQKSTVVVWSNSPYISFKLPNLPVLIQEIERNLLLL